MQYLSSIHTYQLNIFALSFHKALTDMVDNKFRLGSNTDRQYLTVPQTKQHHLLPVQCISDHRKLFSQLQHLKQAQLLPRDPCDILSVEILSTATANRPRYQTEKHFLHTFYPAACIVLYMHCYKRLNYCTMSKRRSVSVLHTRNTDSSPPIHVAMTELNQF